MFKIKKILCYYCGKEFEPKPDKLTSKYCSDECRVMKKNERSSKYRKKNREKIRESARKCYHKKVKKNPGIRKILSKRSLEYRHENIEKVKKREQEYNLRNSKRISEQKKKWWRERGKKIIAARKEGKYIAPLKIGRPRKK